MLNAELAVIGQLKTAPEIHDTRKEPFVVLALLVPNLMKVDGKPQDGWCRTTAFGSAAAEARKLTAGDLVFARGKPTLDKWRDNNSGTGKSGLSMIAVEVVRLGTDLRPPKPEAPKQQRRTTEPSRARPRGADLPYGLPPTPKAWNEIRIKPEPRSEWQAPLADWSIGDPIDDILAQND